MLAFAATIALALQLPCGAPPRTRPLRMQLTDQEQKISEAMEIKPVSAESARSTGLALALDDGTRKSHSVAENTAFVTGFFRGIATKQAFGQLVASLYFVYDAMESAFTECDDEGVRALDYPQLRRRAIPPIICPPKRSPRYRVYMCAINRYGASRATSSTRATYLRVAGDGCTVSRHSGPK